MPIVCLLNLGGEVGVMREYFDVYVRRMYLSKIRFDEDAAEEVKDRLWQAEYALAKHNEYIEKYKSATESSPQGVDEYIGCDLRASDELFNNGKFYTESFYYFSFRIYKILTHKSKPLPFLEEFTCPGVLMTRNHLIEHPEGASSNAKKYSYSLDYERGVLLRTANDFDQKVRDKGSIFNSKQFRDNLIKIIKKSYIEILKDNPNSMPSPENI